MKSHCFKLLILGTSCCSDVKNDAKTKKHEVTLFQIVDVRNSWLFRSATNELNKKKAKQKADVEGSTEFFASVTLFQIVDARNSLLFRCEDLKVYANELDQLSMNLTKKKANQKADATG
ncbi:hypothetical protein HELRODRAFT_173918 [Helobdella robusta]|uniref:Uncharacterized protein n=1 Tax=Helobdella robusta TaxID=6412 RepID=T1F7D7_HELRO|nr:hypothetical protein HELRODRAFT_173918 [Helobdella robusta]ESO03049.1 hypothetical protein HELRODRAFT_173918 [Helobdella robusta]